ncbi:hypothetical protein PRIPAC_97833 [Pristionchus pacificus]|uniref:Peptidase n=1 Tax=Pristionchus pacificus TaxID=54126 RepID=A0A454XXY8_PRIPA|nr:hypothetical protein PRIPAC_97833 [Pristionchus pacificus]|eukprot:PDM84379.1 Peptidase [Pristionchus pacificus]
MSNKGVGIAFKLTALVLLLSILGVSIGILIVSLNVRDDVEATPAAPTYPTTVEPASTKAPPPPPPPTTTASAPLPPCTNAPPEDPKTDTPDVKTTEAPDTKTTTEEPMDPVDPVDPEEETKNIPEGEIIKEKDPRFNKFSEISNLYEKWMDVKVDPCNDFYHYVCGKGQKNGEQSPFDISQIKDNNVEAAMWQKDQKYWDEAPLPVKQIKWFRDKCHQDDSYTMKDRQDKIKEMLQQLLDMVETPVPFFKPHDAFVMDATALSKLAGYAKGQFGAFALLTTYVSQGYTDPDTSSIFVDQPLPIFIDSVYADDTYPDKKAELVGDISSTISTVARMLGVTLDADSLQKMSEGVVEFDKVISQTMQQDPIVRRQVARNNNPYTLADLNVQADQFEWVTYMQSALVLLGGKEQVVDGTWTAIIMEKDFTLDLLNNLIKTTEPATVANYVFFKAFSQILNAVPLPRRAKPESSELDKYRAEFHLEKKTLTGMLRKPIPDLGIKSAVCGQIAEALLPWPASRLYVDQDIPDVAARKDLKDNVAEIAKWIFFGFRSQLDQLNWMDKESKVGAFEKLDDLQLNVAYPDWVTDDAQLTAYYKDLDITEDDSFMNIVLKLTTYFRIQQAPNHFSVPHCSLWLYLLPETEETSRPSLESLTHGKYQPQLNSITFPEGILQEPFYSPDYPLATIFGGLGAISGHELTHGFDDEGVQWDGFGALKAWMSDDSQKSFNKMAQCVIDEYSSFCPFKPNECVNGANTQGENIADNGGIQAAYKALKAYESLNGADPRLPGFGSTFTSDQLFFLTFAQTWCDKEQDENHFVKQTISDVHSPALYRVLGTIQNFPAFKNAFNCPADTPYTPTKHCDRERSVADKKVRYKEDNGGIYPLLYVTSSLGMSNKGVGIAFKLTALVLLLGILGVSIGILIVSLNVRDDVEATSAVPTYPTTVPPATTASAPLQPCAPPDDTKTTTEEPVDPVDPVDPEEETKNIPEGKIIKKGEPRFDKFSEISNLFEQWMDVKVDPCNDFYHYVCGKGQKNNAQSPFLISTLKDNQIENAMWQKDQAYWDAAPLPVKQINWFRQKCHSDDSYTVKDQQDKTKEMLQQYLGMVATPVPFFTPNVDFVMDATALSKLAGYAKGQFGAYALLTTYVSQGYTDPDTSSIFVDEPLPIFVASVYADNKYPLLKGSLVGDISSTITTAAQMLGMPNLDAKSLKKMSTDVVEFDKIISTTMKQDPIVRRQVDRNNNPHTLDDLNVKADQFDWVTYVKAALVLLGGKEEVVDGSWKVIIMEEDFTLKSLNELIKTTEPATVANYVFYKAFSKILSAVPDPPATPPKSSELDQYRAEFHLEKKTLTRMLRKPSDPDQKANGDQKCRAIAELVLPWPASRLYVDQGIPNPVDRKALKDNVAEIANWIFFGFRSQLDQLNWMDKDSKKGAFEKLDDLQLNIAYPDWVTDNDQLTAYYKDLDITVDDNFMNIVLKLNTYSRTQEVLPLVVPTPRDRGDFSSFIGITNAWYQPQLNSITFPEGILQEPFYSPDYPLATIFGGLGAISGHELTHGFDDEGVQWDGIGALKAWMSDDSQKSFNKMAQCVIDEYSSFCPFKPNECVNGANTQGENIADNGGIQAAYKALKAYESLNGADPRLPGFGSTFNSDQLFFLTFAQTWCDAELNEFEFVIDTLADVHSPAYYRVLGTIQNFPAFKNAFNCPADTPYTPTKHCDVWTSKPF